jgi:hypothetical protein
LGAQWAMRRNCSWLALFISAILAACSGSPVPNAGPFGNTSALPAVRQNHPRARTLPSQLLFVPNEDGTIGIYPLDDPSAPIAQITGLQAYQQQMVVDASGDLFVVNNGPSAGDDYVAEYAPPYTGAPTILNTVWQSNIFYPVGVAVDAQGTVYVSNCGSYCLEMPSVFVYPPGSTSPAKAITSAGFDSLAGLAADAPGNLWIVNWDDHSFGVDVFKVKAGSTQPKALKLHGLVTGNGGNGVTLDAKGDLYVSNNASGSDYVLEYKPGKRNAFRIIDSMPFTVAPTTIEVGPDKNLYVPVTCVFPPCVQAYAFKQKGKKPFETIGATQNATTTLGIATAPNLLLQGGKR